MDKLDQPKKRLKADPKESTSSRDDEIDSDDLEEIDYGDDDFDLDSDTRDETLEEEERDDRLKTKVKEATTKKNKPNQEQPDLRAQILKQRALDGRAQGQHEEDQDDDRRNDRHIGNSDEEDNQEDGGKDGDGQTKIDDDEKPTAERCKYWPTCNLADECTYYHPTKPCRAFPNCRFGNKCLYIHPSCKFALSCARPNCPFAHPTGPVAVKRRAPVFVRPFQQPTAPKCKYGFKCVNIMCKFSHQASEPCRFGANCLLETCPYTHPSDMARKKPANVFKWSAQS